MIPEKALQYIKDKKLQTSFSYKDIWNEEHATAFTVAKVMQVDILQDMKNAIEKAIENGETFESFKKNLLPTLEAKGWAGKKTMTDPLTGEKKEVYINTPRRLKTIYDTNLRSAYQKGRFEHAMESEMHPYLMYRLGPVKTKHRDEHSSWDGLILPKNDAWWNAHMPPNGYGCKCYVVAVTEDRKKKYENSGVPTAVRDGETTFIKVKTASPKTEYKTYVNERKGIIEKVPFGVHPSFNFNQAVVTRDLPILDAFMRRGKQGFPTRYEKIVEAILTSQIKKEQFESWLEKSLKYLEEKDKGIQPHNMTAVGFINTKVARFLKSKNIDIGESVTVGLEARLLNSIKAIRHAGKGEALLAKDGDNILSCLLYGDAYFQKDNGYILYLYKVDDRYIQMAVDPVFTQSAKGSSLKIPSVKNIQFINELQKNSKFDSNDNWELIK